MLPRQFLEGKVSKSDFRLQAMGFLERFKKATVINSDTYQILHHSSISQLKFSISV